ncbi:MAG: DUF72 domain-containing protein [Planctomycetota bacterium]
MDDSPLEQDPPDPRLACGPLPARVANIRVGTASWTEKTLLASGAFYPARVTSAADRLRYYARHFAVVEVDSTFYSLPTAATAAAWVERTPADFAFGVKAFAAMTLHPFAPARLPLDLRAGLPEGVRDRASIYPRHVGDASSSSTRSGQRFRAATQPLLSGKLGYVPFQMPRWFIPSPASGVPGTRLPQRLPGFPLAVEFRAQGCRLGERLR